MIQDLSITGYRGFPELRLRGAARVNLIVGRNNSGKTSVLEAIRLLASGRDVSTLAQVAIDRGEVVQSEEAPSLGRRPQQVADISHFFHGHALEIGSRFDIDSGNGLGSYGIRIVDIVDSEEDLEVVPPRTVYDEVEGEVDLPRLAVRVSGSGDDDADAVPVAYAVGDNGAFNPSPSIRYRGRGQRPPSRSRAIPLVTITQKSLTTGAMTTMWNQQYLEGNEHDAIEALQLLDDRIREIAFLPVERTNYAPSVGIFIRVEGERKPFPLGSMGDGMRRMLALSLATSHAKKGFLLVDEIDTGLHWTAMPRMWSLVARAAEELDVQVFATTHSLDCLHGLVAAVEDENYLTGGPDVAVFRLDRDLTEAVRYSADELEYAVTHDTEIRGR